MDLVKPNSPFKNEKLLNLLFQNFSGLAHLIHIGKKGFLEHVHGLRTPNEGINQRYLKHWAEMADKICFGRT